MRKLSPEICDLSKGFHLTLAATLIPGKSGHFSEGKALAKGKPIPPDQGLPGNALKHRGRRRQEEKRHDLGPEPGALPPASSSSPPLKPQSDGSRLQPGPGITGGQPPSTTPLVRLCWEKHGRQAQGVPQFWGFQPQIPGQRWLGSLPLRRSGCSHAVPPTPTWRPRPPPSVRDPDTAASEQEASSGGTTASWERAEPGVGRG